MTQAAMPTATAADVPVLPQGFATAGASKPSEPALPLPTAAPVLQAFGEQLARSAAPVAAEPQAEVAKDDEEAPSDSVEPAGLSLPDAEQWLSSMLAQQAVDIQAREGTERVPEPAGDNADALPADGLAALLAAQVQPLPVALPSVRVAVQGGAGTAPAVDSAPLSAGGGGAVAHSKAAEILPVLGKSAESLDSQLLAQLDRLSGAAQAPAADAPAGATGQAPLQSAPTLDRQLSLQGPEAKWGEQLLHALRDSVELQTRHSVQNASIRLDPPELGSLEIYLSHESGRLNVQISAAQGDVARLLQQTSDRLRQELVGQNFVQVNVQVSADSQSGGQHARQAHTPLFEDEPVAARPQGESASGGNQNGPASDVLVTV